MTTEKNILIKDLERMYDNPRHIMGNLDLSIWLQYQDATRSKRWREAFAMAGILLFNGSILYLVAAFYANVNMNVSWGSFILFIIFSIPVSLVIANVNQFLFSQFTKDKELMRLISQHNQAVETAIKIIERRL